MFKKIIFILLGIIAAVLIAFVLAGVVKPTYSDVSSVTINAPVSKTFAIFNDTTQMGKWIDGFKSIKLISGAANEVGSKWELVFDEKGRKLVMTETVTAFEAEKHFAFDLVDEFGTFHTDITFEEVNGQTIVTQTMSGVGNSMPAKSMIAIMGGEISKQQAKVLGQLKALVEKS